MFAGWLVYIRKPLEAGQPDPLKRALGPVYTLLENKYYVDELYDFVFVRPSIWLAEKVVYRLIDRGIIDGFLHFVANAAEWIAFRHKDFDTQIINEGADNLAEGFGEMSDSFKYIQSGRIQQYLAVAVAGLLMLVGVFVWSLFIR